jgi:uncharacterized protein (DUF433 family)
MTAQVIQAFTEDQAAHLTGVSVNRLRHWDKTKFFAPSLGSDNRRLPFSRIYSFRDLLSLQILKTLRDEAKCSLQHLREVRDRLEHLGSELWSRVTLFVLKRKVVFYDEETRQMREPVSGQGVLQIPLRIVRSSMEKSVRALSQRDATELGKINRKRNVNHNAAVVSGTRVPVGSIKRLAEDGFSTNQILAEFPSLTEADVAAALKYRGGKHAA